MLIRDVNIVSWLDEIPESGSGPVDVRLRDDSVVEIGERLDAGADEVLEADGRWLMPGLWDQHLHLGQWVDAGSRLDLSDTADATTALRQVEQHIWGLSEPGWVLGQGHRTATWPDQPTVRALDAISGDHPVLLVSGDAHHAWCNSAALRLLGLPERDGVVAEQEWFEAARRLPKLTGGRTEDDYRKALTAANAMGLVGMVDMEFGSSWVPWLNLAEAGELTMRGRVAVYPDQLDEVIAAGWRTGDALEPSGMVTMGPLKVIADGSLNTQTALCREPYADTGGYGHANYGPSDLLDLVSRATAAGLSVALHAIGDAAIRDSLTVFEQTGARGSIEHVQLATDADIHEMARLKVTASVQPAHLLDDYAAAQFCWPDRMHLCYRNRSLADAGVSLALGSDAPVAPLDPWLAISSAIYRNTDEGMWNPREALTCAQAIAGSVDDHPPVTVGSLADLTLVDFDPLLPDLSPRDAAAKLREGSPASAIMIGGEVVWSLLD